MVSRVEVAPLYTLPEASTPRPPAESAVSQVFPELVNCVVEEKVAKVEEAIRERGLPVSQRPVVVAETVWPAYVWLYEKSEPPVALMVRAVPPMLREEVAAKARAVPAEFE